MTPANTAEPLTIPKKSQRPARVGRMLSTAPNGSGPRLLSVSLNPLVVGTALKPVETTDLS